jgi:hypothetical protein
MSIRSLDNPVNEDDSPLFQAHGSVTMGGQTFIVSPRVDLRALEYLGEFDDHLMCAICRCPYIRPIRLKCDHIFCQRCFDRAQNLMGINGSKCPSCRSPTEDTYLSVPRIIANMIDDLKVKCPKETEGCKEIVTRGFVQTHVDKYCMYSPMDCPEPTCQKTTLRKDYDPGKCLHVEAPCANDCNSLVSLQDMEVLLTFTQFPYQYSPVPETSRVMPQAPKYLPCLQRTNFTISTSRPPRPLPRSNGPLSGLPIRLPSHHNPWHSP